MQHSRLKKRMTRHESRVLRPKAAGPSVPAEKERMLKLVENQRKKILKNCVSVLSSRGTGKIPRVCE